MRLLHRRVCSCICGKLPEHFGGHEVYWFDPGNNEGIQAGVQQTKEDGAGNRYICCAIGIGASGADCKRVQKLTGRRMWVWI